MVLCGTYVHIIVKDKKKKMKKMKKLEETSDLTQEKKDKDRKDSQRKQPDATEVVFRSFWPGNFRRKIYENFQEISRKFSPPDLRNLEISGNF